MSENLLAERAEERKFIAQMLDGRKVDTFGIPVAINANLRKYQQDGVNWLAFLNKYQLHGVLCDGMLINDVLLRFRYGTRQDVTNDMHYCQRSLSQG